MNVTRTFTRYFAGDLFDELCEAARRLEADWLERRPHVDRDTQSAGDRRIRLLYDVLVILGDRVS